MSADLDKLIDRAVHEVMDVEPRADLRARVIQRIERPQHAVRWTWILAPIAGAVALVLAAALWQPKQPLITRAVTQMVARPAEMRLPPPVLHREDRPSPPRRIPTVSRRDRRIAAAVAPEASQPTIELDPLLPIEAISTPAVALQALDTQQIGPAPLAPLAQIEIEPVNSSAGRN